MLPASTSSDQVLISAGVFFVPLASKPGADVLINFSRLNGGFELRAGDALETEEHVVERTIVMIFAQRSGDAGAAFIRGAVGDDESAGAFTRAVRGLFWSGPGQ